MTLDELKAIYGVMISPPPYRLGSPWANYAGLTLLRIAWNELWYATRGAGRRTCASARPRSASGDHMNAPLVALEREGVAVIRDFLPRNVHAGLADAFDRVAESPSAHHTPDAAGSGVDSRRCTLGNASQDERLLRATFVDDPRIRTIAEGLMRRTIVRPPSIVLQRLEVPTGGMDRGDSNSTLHADRFFPTLKCFYVLNDHDERNGTFVYCKRSHRLTAARLRYEYTHSIADAKRRKRTGLPMWFYHKSVLEDMRYGKVDVPEETLRAMGVSEEPVCAPANSLILTNNRGFHRRGTMQPGTVRKQLRIIFHYLEEPRYAPALQAAVRKSKQLAARTSDAAMHARGRERM